MNPFIRKVWRFFATRPSSHLCMLGILLGFGFGFTARIFSPSEDIVSIISFPGLIFINSLKVMVLIFVIVVMMKTPMDMVEIGSAKKLGLITLVYFFTTTFIATLISLIFVNTIRPGTHNFSFCVAQSSAKKMKSLQKVTLIETILNIGKLSIPPNIFKAIVEDNIMGILTIFLTLGFCFAAYNKEKRGENFKEMLDLIYQGILDILELVIKYTPAGVFSLVAGEIVKMTDNCIFLKLLMYIVTYLVTVFVHVMVVLNSVYYVVTRKNPFKHIQQFFKTIIMSFSTASSAATLPLNLKIAYETGCDQNIANFVMPLGTTLNMNGAAIYFPVTIIFISLMLNKPVNFATQLLCCFVASLVTMGSAPIPSGALVYLSLVAKTVGVDIPNSILTLIWSIDPIMDRFITCLNVLGDSYATRVIEVIYKWSSKNKKTEKLKDEVKDIL